MIQENKFNTPAFESVMNIVLASNQREAGKVIKSLRECDEHLFKNYKSRISNSAVLEYLEA
jgi:hypothetical protein